MATKKEVWLSNSGSEWANELGALSSDLFTSLTENLYAVTTEVTAAVDALHEYVHRGEDPNDYAGFVARDEERNDWVKRYEALEFERDQLRVELKAMTAERDEWGAKYCMADSGWPMWMEVPE